MLLPRPESRRCGRRTTWHRPRILGGGAVRGRGRRRDLPRLPAQAAHRPGPRLRGRGGALGGRRAVRDAADHRQGRDGHRVAGAARPGPHARGAVAAVPELRDHGDQALAGGDDRGGPPGRVRHQGPADRAARRRQDRREGSGDRVPPRPVAPVGVLPSAGRPAAGRPDDHRVRDQRRRRELDLARHRAERDAGPVGLPRRAGHRGALRRGRGHGLLRRAGQRRGELRGADRGRHRLRRRPR